MLPPLPAAAIDRMPAAFRLSNVVRSVALGSGPPSDMLMTLVPAAWHFLAALARVDEKQVTAVQAILTRLGLEFKSGA